jgi:hypothetical protein
MKRLLLVSSVVLVCAFAWLARTSAAPAPTRLLRSPTVSANAVAFTYASNVWIVERAGGVAMLEK